MIKKKGDFNISFGVIFSVIIIAAIVAVAFYTLNHFLTLKKCTDLGFVTRDLQNRVDDVWESDSARDTFTVSVPSSVDKVCFGQLTSAQNTEEYEVLKRWRSREANFFFYPLQSSCEINYAMIQHVDIQGFFCIDANAGKVSVNIVKNSGEPLVRVSAP